MGKILEKLRSLLQSRQGRDIPRDFMEKDKFEKLFQKKMENDKERSDTFLDNAWAGEMSVKDLAKAGFCYNWISDNVVCFDCKGIISNWCSFDVPIKLHRQVYPECKFALSNCKKLKKGGGLSFDGSSETTDRPTEEVEEEDEMYFFKSEFNRLMSFKNWPLNSPVDRYDLAATGFYCIDNTSVVCVGCFAEVSDWKLGDQPRENHIQLEGGKSCPFAKQREEREIEIVEIRQFIRSECASTKEKLK